MARGISEPANIYWAVGVAASLALHASGVAGAALLVGHYARDAVPTEITFSDEASPAAKSAPAQAETVSASAAAPVEQERLIPSAAPESSVTSTAEALQPVTSEAATPEATQPLETAALETTQPLQVAPASTPEAQQLQAEPIAPEAAQSSQPPALSGEPAKPAEAIQPAASAETAATGEAEMTTALISEDTLSLEQSAERLVSTAPTEAVSGDAPEKVAAFEPPSDAGLVPAISADRPEPAATPATAPSAESVAPISPQGPATEPATSVKPEAILPSGKTSSDGTETAVALSPQAEAAAPIGSQAETVTGIEPEAVPSGTLPQEGASGPVTIVPALPEVTTPIEEPIETALLVPARPDSSFGTEVDQPSDRYRRIVDFVRGYAGGDCFIALPAMNLEGDVTFQTFGRDKLREDAFRKALLGLDGLRAEISSGNVADPQCLALSFARSVERYPGFSLMIDLDDAEMASGTELSGSVLNANGRKLHLLLVDDEGQVQSLDQVLSEDVDADRSFRTPLTLTSGPVVTKQILVAITTDPALPSLTDKVNEPAYEFFQKLGQEIDAVGADVDLAVEGFSVN